jgi:hypothetical protein
VTRPPRRWASLIRFADAVTKALASTAGWGVPEDRFAACLFPDCDCTVRCRVLVITEAAQGPGGDPFAGFPQETRP